MYENLKFQSNSFKDYLAMAYHADGGQHTQSDGNSPVDCWFKRLNWGYTLSKPPQDAYSVATMSFHIIIKSILLCFVWETFRWLIPITRSHIANDLLWGQ